MKLIFSGSLLLVVISASKKAFNPKDPDLLKHVDQFSDDEDIPLRELISTEFAAAKKDDKSIYESFPPELGSGEPKPTPKLSSVDYDDEDYTESSVPVDDDEDVYIDTTMPSPQHNPEPPETSKTTTVEDLPDEPEATPKEQKTVNFKPKSEKPIASVLTCNPGFVLKKVGHCQTSPPAPLAAPVTPIKEGSGYVSPVPEGSGVEGEAALYSTGLAQQVIYKNEFNFHYNVERADPEPCEEKCVDINECDEDENICPAEKICHNIDGGYGCCPIGYEYRIDDVGSEFDCFDKNECDLVEQVCGLDKYCTNLEGSYACCGQGFEFSFNKTGLVPTDHCKDINECESKLNPCDLRPDDGTEWFSKYLEYLKLGFHY